MSKRLRDILRDYSKVNLVQALLVLGIIRIIGEILYWGEFTEAVLYFIYNLPLAILLIHYSNKVIYENSRPNWYYNIARAGTIVGILLLIPKWLLYIWFGWQIGLLG